jgi:hypothetical protein
MIATFDYNHYDVPRSVPIVAIERSTAKMQWDRIPRTIGAPMRSQGSAVEPWSVATPTLPAAKQIPTTTSHDARSDVMNALIRELVSYHSLPSGWDGYNGHPANSRAFYDAMAFLEQLPSSLPPPSPMLAGSGSIGLYWDRGDYYASLEFEGNGTYTFLTDGPDGYKGAEGIAASTLPTDLRRHLMSQTTAG